jgi:NADP-dependent 3-hydroxy acid dehydrogenase YdfG
MAKNLATKMPKLPPFFLNKVVVITGASSGIGRTLSFWYLNNGAKVVMCGRDILELQNIGKEFPSQALVVNMDLTDDRQCFDMK